MGLSDLGFWTLSIPAKWPHKRGELKFYVKYVQFLMTFRAHWLVRFLPVANLSRFASGYQGLHVV